MILLSSLFLKIDLVFQLNVYNSCSQKTKNRGLVYSSTTARKSIQFSGLFMRTERNPNDGPNAIQLSMGG